MSYRWSLRQLDRSAMRVALWIVMLLSAPISRADDLYPYVTRTINLPGFVKSLALSSKGDKLFALVGSDGQPKPADRSGLYVLDVTAETLPRQVAYFPIASPIGMEIADDGNTVFVYGAFFHGFDPKAWYGVSILDLRDSQNIRKLAAIDVDVQYARLSPSTKLLLVHERKLRNPKLNEYFKVFNVEDRNKPALLSTALPEGTQRYAIVYGLLPNRDGSSWIVSNGGERFTGFDLSDPSTPRKLFETTARLGAPLAGANGVLYFGGDNQITVVRDTNLELVGSVQGSFRTFHGIGLSRDKRTVYVPSLDKKLVVLDVADPGRPAVRAEFPLPKYVASATESPSGHLIYAGIEGAVAVLDPSKQELSAAVLIHAHEAALKQYERKDLKFDFERVQAALNLLEAGGVREALLHGLPELSDKRLAAILNDYGFFLAKQPRNRDATVVFRRVLTLDPKRVVAYLNLGDALRAQLDEQGTLDEKRTLTAEIKKSYEQYNALRGKRLPAVDDFLGLNVVDTPIDDVCQYIATYANHGRLREILGSGKSVKRASGKGMMTVDIRSEGTAHIPTVYLSNAETREPLDGAEEFPRQAHDDNPRGSDDIGLVPFRDGHHLVSYNDGDYLVSSSPIGAAAATGKSCEFSVKAVRSLDPRSEQPQLCAELLNKHPPYIKFESRRPIDYEELQRAGYSETDVNAVGIVDFDNDSKPDTLALLQYASGAGPGCDYNFFELLNRRGDRISSSPGRRLLLDLQGVGVSERARHPVPCGGNATGWFQHKGRIYYETRYPGHQPQSSLQAFHRISYIQDKKVHDACIYNFKPEAHP